MKTRLLIIFIVIIGAGMVMLASDTGNSAYGMWFPLSPESLIEKSRTIFVGTITEITPVDFEYQSTIARDGTIKDSVGPEIITLEEYTVDVEEFLKNPQDSDTVKVLRATVGGVPSGPAKISGFEIGDRVLFYLPNNETHFEGQYMPESFKIPKQCDAKTVLEKPKIKGANDFRMIQDGITIKNNFTANKKIQFVFDKDLRTLNGSGFTVDVVISKVLDNKEHQTILEESIHAESQSCEWIATAQWDFIPTAGGYAMWMSYAKDGDSGRSTSSSGFSVVENTTIDLPPLVIWNKHHAILDGMIVEKIQFDEFANYHIKINKVFKGDIKAESISGFANPYIFRFLDEGDNALIYLGVRNEITPYSVKTTKNCDARDFIEIAPVLPNEKFPISSPARNESYFDPCIADYFSYDPDFFGGIVNGISPLKQVKHGIPNNMIRCYDGLNQVIKYDGSPACVKPETIPKLIERGWGTSIELENNNNLSFNIITPESTQALFYAQPQITSIVLEQDSKVRVHLFSYIKELQSGEWDHIFDRAFDEVPKNFEIGIVENTPENIKEFATVGKENLPHGIQVELSREQGYFVVYLTSDKSLNLGKYVLSVVSVDKKTGSTIEKPLYVIAVESSTASTQDNIIQIRYSKHPWTIDLVNISEQEYWVREDDRSPWPPSPILDITQDNLHPHVKELIDAMWEPNAKYVPSEYNQNILMVENTDISSNVEPTEIRDWLKNIHDQQFQRNLDDSFSGYIQYDDKIYLFEFMIAD